MVQYCTSQHNAVLSDPFPDDVGTFFHCSVFTVQQTIAQHTTSPHLTPPHLTPPHPTPPHLTPPHLTSPHLTSPHLTSPHLTSPYLTSPHLTSPHLTLVTWHPSKNPQDGSCGTDCPHALPRSKPVVIRLDFSCVFPVSGRAHPTRQPSRTPPWARHAVLWGTDAHTWPPPNRQTPTWRLP